jgi:tetratricopeptide (TPR) repeat protein
MVKPPFSVVVIARNEAHSLPSLIESLEPFLARGGEMIVVDTGSEDDTVAIAEKAGARVERAGSRFHSPITAADADRINGAFTRRGEAPLAHEGEMLFDFGAARQLGSTLASNDFVWHIDASDVVLTADYEFIEEEIRSGGAMSFQYVLKLGADSFYILRFFDRRIFAWRGKVHEAPYDTGAPKIGQRILCTEEQLSLRHTRHEKTRVYMAGLALDTLDDPSISRWRHYLGRELQYAGRHRAAIAVLREHAKDKTAWNVERAESLCLMGACYEALKRPEDAAGCYLRATILDPTRRHPFLRLAYLAKDRSDFLGSVAFAAAALMIPRATLYVEPDQNYTTGPHALLYWGLFWLGRRDEAKVHWKKCRELDPENEKFKDDARFFAE